MTNSYNLDNTLSGSTYALGSGSTAVLPPALGYAYDSIFPRVTAVSLGGTAVTSYVYGPITGSATTGAGQVIAIYNTLTGGTANVFVLTVTFADRNTTTAEAQRRFHSFATGLFGEVSKGRYVKFLEFQKRGTPHYHIISPVSEFRHPG